MKKAITIFIMLLTGFTISTLIFSEQLKSKDGVKMEKKV